VRTSPGTRLHIFDLRDELISRVQAWLDMPSSSRRIESHCDDLDVFHEHGRP
jgi:hypothetical protein